MKKCLGDLIEAFEAFDRVLTKTVSSPAAKWLMTVDGKREKLSVEKSDKFHSMVGGLLLAEKRGIPCLSYSQG